MVGIPASGKSTKAEELVRKGAVIISSDKVREELFGDANIHYTDEWLQGLGYDGPEDNASKEMFANRNVFDIVYRRCSESLRAGTDVIIDSTSCNRTARKLVLDNVRNAARRICLVMAVPYKTCCLRNSLRKRIVPDDAMKRIAGAFEFPKLEEGFDEIEYVGDINDIDYGEAISS